jgi:hypothetical protein
MHVRTVKSDEVACKTMAYETVVFKIFRSTVTGVAKCLEQVEERSME